MHIISFSSKDALLSNHWECIVLFRVIHINACCTSSLPKHEMKVGTHKIYFTLRIIVIRLNNKLVLGFRRQLFISFFAFEKVAVQYILRPCNRKTSCTYFQPFHKWGGQNFLPSIIHLLPSFPVTQFFPICSRCCHFLLARMHTNTVDVMTYLQFCYSNPGNINHFISNQTLLFSLHTLVY